MIFQAYKDFELLDKYDEYMTTDSQRINLLETKIVSFIYYDGVQWNVGKSKDKIFGTHFNLRQAIHKCFNIQKNNNIFNETPKDSFDCQRLNFLDKKLFNLIYFDAVTNLWVIKDYETNNPYCYGKTLRETIDKLIH